MQISIQVFRKKADTPRSSSESARLAPLGGAGQTPGFAEARLFD